MDIRLKDELNVAVALNKEKVKKQRAKQVAKRLDPFACFLAFICERGAGNPGYQYRGEFLDAFERVGWTSTLPFKVFSLHRIQHAQR